MGQRLSGSILRSFFSRDSYLMLTLFKCVVLSRIDYGTQLWCPFLKKDILALESVQRSFTKHIFGMQDFDYKTRLSRLGLYSLQRRRERYLIIYIWKILEKLVPDFSPPITSYVSTRRGRLCNVNHVPVGRLGSLMYNSFRWKATRLFNCLPNYIRNSSSCSTLVFKKRLDNFLSSIEDDPTTSNSSNSLDHLCGYTCGGYPVVT